LASTGYKQKKLSNRVTIALHKSDNRSSELPLAFDTGRSVPHEGWPNKRGETALVPISKRETLFETGAVPPIDELKGAGTCTPLAHLSIDASSRVLRGDQLTREAVLLTFCDPLPEQCSRLFTLSRSEWRRLTLWLDISGLALYFLNRLNELGISDLLLPQAVSNRLNKNLIDNTARTNGMISESVGIQQDFQMSSLSYAVLKGLSFWPNSVPRPELRSQFDLDFLVAAQSASKAREILENRGYRLYATSGRSWEFKLNERPGFTLKDIYSDLRSYAVELHIQPGDQTSWSPLDRLEWRTFHGMSMPVLSPVDLFLGQGLHVYKHICGEFSRAAHLLEFRRHVLARRDDNDFWGELQWSAREHPRASLALGVVTLLISRVMGDFAPEELARWTVCTLSRSVRLWIEMYGHRAVLGIYPGTKLYLLLQKELAAAGAPAKRPIRQALLPSRLPPPVIRPFEHETLPIRLGRYHMQLKLILVRFRFHVVEGLRFLFESYRWRRLVRDAR
jgi:hypothetical protein